MSLSVCLSVRRILCTYPTSMLESISLIKLYCYFVSLFKCNLLLPRGYCPDGVGIVQGDFVLIPLKRAVPAISMRCNHSCWHASGITRYYQMQSVTLVDKYISRRGYVDLVVSVLDCQ